MTLQFLKAGTSDALVLNAISRLAFDSDAFSRRTYRVYVAEIPYKNDEIRSFVQTDAEWPDHRRGGPFPERGHAEYRKDIH